MIHSDAPTPEGDLPKVPYFGSAQITDPRLFFGRDRETEELFHRLIANRILVLCAVSGAGKSSLVKAGLMPRLRKAGFHLFPVIRIHEPLPDDLSRKATINRFCWSMLRSLTRDASDSDSLTALPLEENFHRAFDHIVDALPNSETSKPSLLIFDQFEQILTIDPRDKGPKEQFFLALGKLLKNRRRWALFVVQEEYIAGLDPYRKLIPSHLTHLFRIDLLDKGNALQAIREPPRHLAAKIDFKREAADSLIQMLESAQLTTDTSAREIPPLYLQVVCTAIWENREQDSRFIGERDLEGIGRVNGALGWFYAQRVKACAESTEGVNERGLRLWINQHLIGRAEAMLEHAAGARHSRRSVYVESGQTSVHDLPLEAIKKLHDARLLSLESRHDGWLVEIAHNGLVEPILEDNRAWLNNKPPYKGLNEHVPYTMEDLELWRHAGAEHRKWFLLTGSALDKAKDWYQEKPGDLTPDDKQFSTNPLPRGNDPLPQGNDGSPRGDGGLPSSGLSR